MASAATFTSNLSTKVGQTRFYAADTDGTGLNKIGGDRTRTDAEIGFLLLQNGNDPRRAAAAILENKAVEYAQAALKTEQGQLKQDFTQRSGQCLTLARELRGQSGSCAASQTTGTPFSMDEMSSW